MTGLVGLVVLGSGALHIYFEQHMIKSELATHHQALAGRLAKVCEESLYQDDLVLVNYFQTLEKERAFAGAAFVDGQGIVKLHSDETKMGRRIDALPQKDLRGIVTPIFFAEEQVGEAHIWFDVRIIQNHLRASLVQSLKRIGVVMLLSLALGLLGAFLLAKTMVGPIQKIVSGMQAISEGRRDPISFEKRRDELGWMAHELNTTINKLKEVDEMKRDFVAGVTHDLKSPLVALKSYIVMMLKGLYGEVPPPQRDVLVTMQNNSARLMQSIDDVLTTSRIEAKKPDLVLSSFDIREVEKEVVTLYRPLFQEKKIAFKAELPPKEAIVWADKEQTFHILSNLVSNAYKFTSQGSVTISVQTRSKDVRISVADTGLGIPEEDRALIFDKFYRIKSKTRKSKGTGLGLYIVKGLLEEQGGSISVEPKPGGGSVFSFTLPQRPLS